MADALCGPSNPLQQFKQQTQHDRSLQQDRLTSRHTPAQGFRSLDPNAGLLDPEFEAFQAGLPPSELPNFPAFHPQSSRLAGPSQAPSWAADFQRMQISSPPPFRQQQQYTPQPSHGGSNWAQGFREQVSQTTPRTQHAAPSPQAFQYMARHGMNGYQNNFAQPNYAQPIQSNGKQPVTEQFDEAAFEQAFDQARDALQAEEQPQNDAEMAQESAYINGASTGNMDQDYASAESLVGQVEGASQLEQSLSDAEREAIRDYNSQLENLQRLGGTSVAAEQLRAHDIQAEDQQMEDIKQPNDDDALAATAEELLQKVEHNQTDKFRNSQFLGLMRKLRDREVKVEGDKMVETAAASAMTTDGSTTKSVHFDNSEQTPQPVQAASQPINAAPYDYGQTIPPHEQDHDAHRHIDPRDGQEVVDLLNQPDDGGDQTRDIGTSNTSSAHASFPAGIFYGDLRQRGWSEMKTDSRGALPRHPIDGSNWERWDSPSPGRVGGQPAPGMH